MESLIRLSEKGDQEGLMKEMDKAQFNQLLKGIRQAASRGSSDIITSLRTVFLGNPPVNDASVKRRLETYKFIITLLQSADLSSSLGTELVGLLLFETDAFPTSSLMQIADTLVDLVKECSTPGGKWLEIVPKVLSSLATRDSVVYDGSEMSGADFKSHFVNSLCFSRWEPTCIVHLAAMFREIPLSSDELKSVVEKLIKTLSEVEIQEIPPLVYQLLLLASKGPRKQVLLGIISFFIDQDNKIRKAVTDEGRDLDLIEDCQNQETLHHTEGTVILHIVFGSRQDQCLGKEFVKIIKSAQHQTEFILAPFTFSVALSLVKIQRFEEQILDVLKGAVLKTFREKERKCHSDWMREIISHDSDPISLVTEAIKNSKCGWDHVTQGLVQFGFILLDSFGPKAAFGRVQVSSKTRVLSATDQACSLGGLILRETFKTHYIVRSEIFEQILNRVIMKSSSPVLHYIDVLAKTVQGAPQLLLEILSKLREILDYLPFLPHLNAVGVLQALTPLLKISMPLKDTLMLVLRKALFNRELETRKIAVSGYLVVLKNLKVIGNVSLSQSQNSQSSSASLSQVRIDVHNNHSSINSEAVCLEIMGTLKRALMQQAEVRQLLYEGLYDVALKNPRVSDIILELLLSQFEKFYDGAMDAIPPLKIGSCVQIQMDETILKEPVVHLITTIQLVLSEAKSRKDIGDDEDDSEYQQNSGAMLEKCLKALVKKLINADLEDFELDKSADFSNANTVGTKNRLMANLLLGVYETLMEYCLMNNNDYNVEACEDTLSLYNKYRKLSEILQEKPAKGNSNVKSKGKKSPAIKASANKGQSTHLTWKFIANIVRALFSDNNPGHQNGLDILRNNKEFIKHVLIICNQKLNMFKDKGQLDAFCHNEEKMLEYFSVIGRVFVEQYTPESVTSTQSKQQQLSMYFIEGLNILFTVIFTSYSHYIPAFLQALEQGNSSQLFVGEPGYLEKLIAKQLEKIQRLTIKVLSRTKDDKLLKEVTPLLSITGHLCDQLPPGNKLKTESYTWIKQLCIDQNIEDTTVAKGLISLCLILSHQEKICVTLLRDVAFDIHHYLGDIEEDVEVGGNRIYAVVNQKTASSLLPLVLHHIEKVLDEIDWVLNVMKANAIALIDVSAVMQENRDREEKERNVCTRLGHLTTVFHEIIQTAFPLGQISNTILKIVIRLYNTLCFFVKYYLAIYQYKVGYLCSRFEKLVKLSGTHLTTQVYTLITYIEAADSEMADKKKKPKADLALKAKVLKESRTVPPLIFAIELYERHLIQLSKKSKVNLMAHIKLSTSRDFRINAATVEAALEQKSDSDETDAEGPNIENIQPAQNINHSSSELASSHQNSISSEPPNKKRRLQIRGRKK